MRRQDVQAPDGILCRIPVRGIVDACPEAVATYTGNGIPTNGTIGFATGCLWRNYLGTYGSLTAGLLWINTGTNTSSQWTNIDSLLPLVAPNQLVTLTGATPITALANGGKTMILSNAAGFTTTMPTANGSGVKYNFFVGTTVTSGNMIITVTADVMSGIALLNETAGPSSIGFLSGAATHTITMNGTTKGGILGDYIELQDVGANQWAMKMVASASGSMVTPLS